VAEFVIFPEMITAGEEALEESEAAGNSYEKTALLVYLAMRGVEEMMLQDDDGETVH
jgi:hypothetical protein